MAFEPISETSFDPAVRGFLHQSASEARDGLILTHGAGGNVQSGLLVALAEAFAEAGFTVLRCDLPFRQRRRFGTPGPGDAERDRRGLKNAVAVIRKLLSGRVFLGGQSYGGRQASMLIADDQLRTQHLPNVHAPTLFVHGTRDPFGSIEEIESSRKLIPVKTQLLTVEGAGHDLGFKGKSRNHSLPQAVLSKFQDFFV